MKNIIIKSSGLDIEARLNNSETAQKIFASLPIVANANTWGEEIYFEIPVKCGLEDQFAKETVDLGDIGYWPQGNCFCIFFGKTPVSGPDEIRPASEVNVIGKVTGKLEVLKKIKKNAEISVEKG